MTPMLDRDREVIARGQDAGVEALVQRVFDQPIPFFRRKMEAAGLQPSDVSGVAGLGRVPTTRKAELRQSEAESPPLGDYRGAALSECVKLGTSAGTSGRPTISLYTPADYATETALGHRAFRRFGFAPGDIMVNAHPGYLYGGAQFVGPMIESYGMLDVSLGPPSPDDDEVARQLEFLETLRPTAFLGYAPAVLRYRDVARRRGREFPGDYGFRSFVLLEPACQLEGPRRWFERLFGVDIYVSTGMVEVFGFYGSECRAHSGLHVNEDHAVIEVLDPASGEPCAPGERGLLTFTTLGKDNPMLRYDSEDVGWLVEGTCPCGEATVRHVRAGRADDEIVVDGRSLLPLDIMVALTACEGLGEEVLQFQAIREDQAQKDLIVLLEPPAGAETSDASRAGSLSEQLSANLGVDARVQFVERSPRFTYKPRRLVGPEALAGT